MICVAGAEQRRRAVPMVRGKTPPPWVSRSQIATVEIATLRDIKCTDGGGFWIGVTPDGSPIVLCDIGTQEIYALDWQAP